MGRIKVLHLITSLDTGGAEVALSQLAPAMDRQRFDNVVVSLTTAGPLTARIKQAGIRVLSVGMSRSLPAPAAFWRLYGILRTERPDVLQTWLYHSDFCGLLTGRAAGIRAIAWNIRCAQTDERYKRGINGMLVRMLARLSSRPDAVIANSQAGREEHSALGYAPRRWAVLENGFDLSVYKPMAEARADLRRELGLSDDTVLIGLVARFDPLKDHAGFLYAAAELISSWPETHFALAGDGVDPDNAVLTGLLAQLGIGAQVHLLGRRNDVPWLTAGLDIATCSSLGEGFPNVVGEAMACAVPCVVTDVGDAARIVGNTGIVVPPGDPGALAKGWSEMVAKGHQGRERLGRSALARIEDRFTSAQCIERYQDFYQDLVHQPAA
jgi:glycosyltransferase involved in cell wall biosynthesis